MDVSDINDSKVRMFRTRQELRAVCDYVTALSIASEWSGLEWNDFE